MKILYDNFIFELQTAGGISKVWFNLVEKLTKCNKSNFYFIEGNSGINMFRKKLNIEPSKIILDKNYVKNIRRFLTVVNNDCDIYHSSYFRPLKVKGNSKVVVTVHDFIYEKYSNFLPRAIHIYLKKRALKQADAVICVSEHTKLDFFEYYPFIDKQRVKVVYNGVDELFQPLVVKEMFTFNKLIFNKNEFLLYVGNRGYCKNFTFVLNLMISDNVVFKNLKLVCIGGGLPTKKEMSNLKKLGLVDNITFLNNVSSIDLNKFYNYTFCLLFPSIYEGFGIPVLEAMQSGCPIWSTHSSSVKELLGHNYPVSFNPHNWQDALAVFDKLCVNSVRESAIESGIIQAKKFSWQKCADGTLEIYESLLNYD